jgi:uncharacterized repeat protein (TIGR03847 family)
MAADPFGERSLVDAQRVRVEAIGEPGQRRFRMMVIADGQTAIMWMEKQQMQALGLALGQMLEQFDEDTIAFDRSDVPIDFDTDTRRQFRVGRIELGYDETAARVVVIIHDINSDDDDEESSGPFACRLTRGQAEAVSGSAASVVAAGRPRCSMCGAPMGPGIHVCAQQNGHLPIPFDDLDEEEAEG